MQIIFDTSRDSELDMRAGIAALQAYVRASYGGSTPETRPVVGEAGPTLTHPAGVVSQMQCRAVIPSVAQAAERAAAAVDAPVTGFIAGDVTAAPAAPSDAGAAASPTVPAAPSAGVPPPPNVSSPPAAPPPAASAPAAPTTSAPSVDVTGLPWDERIHAANKGTNADGRWRKKKGLNDAAFIGRIEAELRNAAPAVAPAASAPVPPPPVTQAPAAGVPPPPVTAPAPPAGPDTSTFRGLMEWVTPLMTTGKLQFGQVQGAVVAEGLQTLSDMSQPQHAASVPRVYAALAALVAQ